MTITHSIHEMVTLGSIDIDESGPLCDGIATAIITNMPLLTYIYMCSISKQTNLSFVKFTIFVVAL